MSEHVEPFEFVNKLIEVFQRVPKIYEINENDINYFDNEMCDIQHELELLNFNAFQGYQLAKRIKENRLKRRKAKDENYILQPLYELITKNQHLLKELQKCQSEMEKRKSILRNREYTPRVRTEMKEVFEKAKKIELVK